MKAVSCFPAFLTRCSLQLLLLCLCNPSFLKANSLDTAKVNQLIRHAKQIDKTFRDSAVLILKTAIEIGKQSNHNEGVSSAMATLGMIYIDQGRFDESIMIFKEALPFSEKGLSSSTGVLYNDIALAYNYKGDYKQAATYFLLAAKTIKNQYPEKPPSLLVLIYNNLATIYNQLEQNNDAIKYLDEAEELANKYQYKDDRLGYAFGTRGNIYMDLQQYDQALESFKKALAIGKQYNNTDLQQAADINTGNIYLKKKMPREAISYLQQALKIGDKNSNPYYAYLQPSYSLGEAYYQLKQYGNAENQLIPAIAFAKKVNAKDGLLDAYVTLSKVFEATNRPWQALSLQKGYVALKDSLLGEEKAKSINELELKYRTAEKDKQLAVGRLQLANKEKELAKKNLWIGGIAGGAVIISLVLGGYYRNNRSKQRLNEAKIKALQKEQELSQLRGIMKGEDKERSRIARELHDGIVGQLYAIKMNFNAVQTEHQLAQSEDFSRAMQQLEDAAGDLRKTAHNLMPDVLLLGGLGEALQIYCQKMAGNYKLDIEFHLYGNLPRLDPDFELSVYRIIQELTTNIVKHAEAGHVIIQLNYQEGLLILTVEDNGKGISPTLTDAQKGMGLHNISSRVKAFNGQMELESVPDGGTTVHVEFEVGKLLADSR